MSTRVRAPVTFDLIPATAAVFTSSSSIQTLSTVNRKVKKKILYKTMQKIIYIVFGLRKMYKSVHLTYSELQRRTGKAVH